jgi:FlaG/FlaF family flagellin (archaellin)
MSGGRTVTVSRSPPDSLRERGLSPVVGGALLVAILVLLAVVSAGLVFGLAEEEPSPPSAALELVPSEDPGRYRLVHRSGDRVVGDRVTLRGVENPTVLAGTDLTAGDAVVDPTAATVTAVWYSGESDSYVLRRFEGLRSVEDALLGGSVLARVDDRLRVLRGDGGRLVPFADTGNIRALGPPTTDFDGDGLVEAPYVSAGGDLKLIDGDGDTATLATDGDLSGVVRDSKTRLAVGAWNGSGLSVLFTGDTDTIYRVTPGGTPQVVATPDDGVNAVLGVGDVDGDGTGELAFAGASQEVRYLDPGGETTGVTAGANDGIGAGSLADFDGDGTERVVLVDGGNDIRFVGGPGGEPDDAVTSGDVAGTSAPQARKSPPTVADVDGDGDPEVVYLGNDDGKLKYLDGVTAHVTSGAKMERRFLTDDAGSRIDGSELPGLTS